MPGSLPKSPMVEDKVPTNAWYVRIYSSELEIPAAGRVWGRYRCRRKSDWPRHRSRIHRSRKICLWR